MLIRNRYVRIWDMGRTGNILIDNICETLKERILRGDYAEGTKLSENMISREFGCSRTPVREVLQILAQDKLVEVQPYSGTYVKGMTAEENLEIMEVRTALEPLAFSLACEKKADTSVLRSLCDEMAAILDAEDPDFISYGRAHYQFHRHLVELSGNALLIETYDRLNLGNSSRLIYQSMTRAEIESTEAEHYKIVEVLEHRDSEYGERFMRNHLWRKREILKAELAEF